mgnify:CR=1 FL=1
MNSGGTGKSVPFFCYGGDNAIMMSEHPDDF